MKNQLLASSILLLTAVDASAGWWREEENKILYADFGTYVFTNPADNSVGKTFNRTLSVNINGDKYKTECDNGTTLSGRGTDIFLTSVFVNGTATTVGTREYTQVNDYLQAAVSYRGINIPTQNRRFGTPNERCTPSGQYLVHGGNTQFDLMMRISRPFVGFTDIDIPVADFYTGDNEAPLGSGFRDGAKQTLHLKGRVVVPQSCVINNDVESIVDFGNIPSYSFKAAGVGNKIAGLPKANMPLSIMCNGFIENNAPLTLRVQTDNVGGPSNDIIVSNNPDIGFKISDQKDNVLIPNNMNSKIQFTNTNPANIVVKAWPVSVTGNQPVAGPFQARGYFRIDFD